MITIAACVELPVLQGHQFSRVPLDELVVSWGKLGKAHRAWRVLGTYRKQPFSLLTDGETCWSFERSLDFRGKEEDRFRAEVVKHLK